MDLISKISELGPFLQSIGVVNGILIIFGMAIIAQLPKIIREVTHRRREFWQIMDKARRDQERHELEIRGKIARLQVKEEQRAKTGRKGQS